MRHSGGAPGSHRIDEMETKLEQTWRRHMTPRRAIMCTAIAAASLAGLLYMGADVASWAFLVAWCMAIVVARRYLGAFAAGILSGCIAATGAALAAHILAVNTHPARSMESMVAAIIVTFMIGCLLPLVMDLCVAVLRWCRAW